jgi:RNA polymerase sigma-70 factor (ECF subfamily)
MAVQLYGSVQSSEALAPTLNQEPPDFRQLFESEFGYVTRTLRYLGVHTCDLEDVTHDVFLHVYRHLPEFDATRPVRPWLFGFAYRIARDFRALARHKHEHSAQSADTADTGFGADELLLRNESLTRALSALDSLDADERAVFVAHVLDELPIPEVAQALAIALNTAYSRLRRARSKFAAAARRLTAKENHL